jgi:hypothetical protein
VSCTSSAYTASWPDEIHHDRHRRSCARLSRNPLPEGVDALDAFAAVYADALAVNGVATPLEVLVEPQSRSPMTGQQSRTPSESTSDSRRSLRSIWVTRSPTSANWLPYELPALPPAHSLTLGLDRPKETPAHCLDHAKPPASGRPAREGAIARTALISSASRIQSLARRPSVRTPRSARAGRRQAVRSGRRARQPRIEQVPARVPIPSPRPPTGPGMNRVLRAHPDAGARAGAQQLVIVQVHQPRTRPGKPCSGSWSTRLRRRHEDEQYDGIFRGPRCARVHPPALDWSTGGV